jgi:hypothetical protein
MAGKTPAQGELLAKPRKPRPFRLRHVEPSESAIQDAIVKALTLHRAVHLVWRANSGAAKFPDGRGGFQFVRFNFKGCPDILGMLKGGRTLAFEVKRRSGRVSPDQRAVIENFQRGGALAGVCRSADDAIALINSALGEK